MNTTIGLPVQAWRMEPTVINGKKGFISAVSHYRLVSSDQYEKVIEPVRVPLSDGTEAYLVTC